VLLSSRGSYVELSAKEEETLSPIHHIERIRSPVIVAHGDEESPKFKRQSRDFASALEEAGQPYQLIEPASTNHFEVITTMAQENGEVARAALGQID
jgi:arylformamidase